MSITKDIETMIEGLSPEMIKALTKEIKKPTVRRIDDRHRQKS